MRLSTEELRRCMIAYQFCFDQSPQDRRGTIIRVFDRLKCVQYDPLCTVLPNADLVLSARVDGYQKEDLWSLLYEDRMLFDYWDKNMSIIPIGIWPLLAEVRKKYAERYSTEERQLGWLRQKVRTYLETHQYMCSSDLKNQQKVDWYWAPAKATRAVLESMYHEGELVIHHRSGSRKYYCQAATVIPESLLQAEPFEDSEQFAAWYLERRIASVGVARLSCPDVFSGTGLKSLRRRELAEGLIRRGRLISVEIEGVKEPLMVIPEVLDFLDTPLPDNFSRLLAPLDTFLWDRNLTRLLFDFSYRWEVYTPKVNRRYGYYVLPLLTTRGLVGRMEPVYDKAERRLHIKHWWPEEGFSADTQGIESVRLAVGRLSESLGAKGVTLLPEALAKAPWLEGLFD